ncbi:serine protease [Streptomyces sp. NPDC058964]|uniref:S1 family peptidase n=1 Tax=Streptomyces sp. NPDC058964 TaxID=3346681 RepID=UPI0036C96FCE
MTRTGERAVKSRMETPRWVARIQRAGGPVVGAGVLLGPDRVLTGAHVVSPDEEYVVHFVGVDGVPAVTATVNADEYVPQQEDSFGDRTGDLALLRLAEPRPVRQTTRLFRLAASREGVGMYGFPEGDDGGRWHSATLVGGRGRDSQVQLRPETPGELAGPGFSGGGVVDHATGELIGIVLSVDTGQGSAFTYMSPTETILRHLPQVAAWTVGPSAVDPKLHPGDSGGELDVPFATELAGWFRGEGWPVLVTAVPARGRRAWTLRRAVTLADRELRTRTNTSRFTGDPPETVPPPGGHDLALVVRGLTVAQVMDRIAERLGVPRDTAVPLPEQIVAMGITLAAVLVGVDESAEPDPLLGMLERLAERGARLLLVFRTPDGRAAQARDTLVRRPLRERWARLRTDLDRIVDRLGPALDDRLGQVLPGGGPETAQLIDRARRAVPLTRLLRGQLAAGPEPEPSRADDLFLYEAAATRRIRRLERTLAVLDARLARRDELRGRVASVWELCKGRAGPADTGRNLKAYELYANASGLLRAAPCDVDAAERAARRFVAYCSGRPGTTGTDDTGSEGMA